MYHEYFGLTEPAFSIAVNPRYLYMSQQHKEALAHLLYGVQGGGFVMLTGEVGTGKTTMVRSLLGQLPDDAEIAIILNPMANVEELLQSICDELGASYYNDELSNKSLTDALHHQLLTNHRKGKRTVLLIDEAQLLSPEVLEQIRLLTNLETETEKLLQIILVGQPELNELLSQPRLRQLSQRIVARFHLTPLSLEETEYYIEHRLSVAGYKEKKIPFTPAVLKRLHHFTGGIPRLINVVCERALIGAYGHNQREVNEEIFELAKREVSGQRKEILEQVKTSSSAGSPLNLAKKFLERNHWQIIIGMTASILLCMIAIMTLLLSRDPVNAVATTQEAPSSLVNQNSDDGTLKGVILRDEPAIEETSLRNTDQTTEAPSIEEPIQETESALTEVASAKTAEYREGDGKRFDISDKHLSEAIFFQYLGFDLSQHTPPCWQLGRKGYECKLSNIETWKELSSLNRPVILSLITEDKFFSYAIVIGLNEDSALIVNEQGEEMSIALNKLGPMWTGAIFYVWKKPPGFKKPLKLGDSSTVVKDVANKFAVIDKQNKPLTNVNFNEALQRRVKYFQTAYGLKDDGILGQMTLMKINEEAGEAFILQRNF